MSGIILAQCKASGASVQALDPQNGAAVGEPREFQVTPGASDFVPCNQPGWHLRQRFDFNFTKEAGAQLIDGVETAGYARANNPQFVPATPRADGYATPRPQSGAVFQPLTDRLFYIDGYGRDDAKLISVSTEAGPATPLEENLTKYTDEHGKLQSFWFSPNGQHIVLGSDPTQTIIYSPEGTELVQDGTSTSVRVADGGTVDQSKPGLPLPDGIQCTPELFVSASTFLCLSANRTKLYLGTLQNGGLSMKQLLSDDQRQIIDFAPAPDGVQIAVLTKLDGAVTLFVASVQGGDPRKVKELGSTTDPALLAWTK